MAADTLASMDIRAAAIAAYRHKGWTPSDLWRAMGGEGSPVKKQTCYAWVNGAISRTTGERYYPELGERHLGLVLDALGLDLTAKPVKLPSPKPRKR